MLKVIKLFNIEENAHRKFQEKSDEYKNLMNSLIRKKDLSSPMSEFLSTIVMVIIMWFGGKLILEGGSMLNAESFIAYILIFSQIIPPAKSFTTAYYRVQKGVAAANRVYELMHQKNNIIEPEDPRTITNIKKGIFINNLNFRYKNKDVLKNINFSIQKGKTTALVGESCPYGNIL